MENNKEYKFTKKEIAKLLGVSESRVEKWEKQDQLKSQLYKIGYNLYFKKKEGRKVYYFCMDAIDRQSKEEYNQFCKDNGVRKKDEFAKYVETRIVNIDVPVSKLVIADKSNINEHTVTAWDKKLMDLGLLSKDGWFYMAIDYRRNEDGDIKPYFRLTDEWEYKSHATIKAKKARLKKRLLDKEIDEETFDLASETLTMAEESFYGSFVYKLNKFKVKDLEQLNEVLKMIKDVYNLKDEDFKITYTESVSEYTNTFLEENYEILDDKI